MKSTCTMNERRWLAQIECNQCSKFNRDNLKHKLYTTHNLQKEAPFPYSILCDSLQRLHWNGTFSQDSQMEVQNWNSWYPKTLHVRIFFKTTCLEHARAISYSLQKVPSNGVLHVLIRDHLTSFLKGFLVRSQIFYLIFNLSFDHNSYTLGLNEWKHFRHLHFKIFPNGVVEAQFGIFFVFSTKHLNIWDFRIDSQNGSALGNHWVPSFVLSPICKNVFHNWTPSLDLMGLCTLHLITNLMLRLQQLWNFKVDVVMENHQSQNFARLGKRKGKIKWRGKLFHQTQLEAFATVKASVTLGTHATSEIMPNAKITTITLEANTRSGVVININLGPSYQR